MPVVFRGPAGGGFRGGPFHSQNPEAWFTHVPGLKVVQPSTPYDAKGLLKAAIRDNNPVIYFEHKHLYRRIREDVPEDDFIVPLGVADIKREGRDLTIVTYGAMVHECLAVAERLSSEGARVRGHRSAVAVSARQGQLSRRACARRRARSSSTKRT